MKKRLLSLLLILCLCAALLPVTALAVETTVTNETDLIAAISNGGTVKLGGNITLTATLVINNTVILDLNGNELNKTASSPFGAAIRVTSEASLTLTDSSQEKTGKISGFDSKEVGGGVYVDGGSFIMTGGSIVSCNAAGNGGGGVYLASGASFTMTGGTIYNCNTNMYNGGGVLVEAGGLFVMNGGLIKNCYANGDGGGVYVNGTFRMTGGMIQKCETTENARQGARGYGGGVYVSPIGKFEMSGGSIEKCEAIGEYFEGKGGGVYVRGTFKMTDGMITGCTAKGDGAGVYVENGATATLIPGNITGNKKSDGTADDIAGPGGYTVYEPDTEIPDYPLISILPALAKDLPFTDVTSTDWFYGDVEYVYDNGLMTGTASDAFSPEAPVTRGMVMTILARREGIRTDRYTPWYAAGCEWAKANDISDGTNPEAPVTREQLAAMLYRYAALKGRDLTAGENTNILSYTDAFDISDYAIPALQWACGEAILTGSNGALNPQSTATRAQLAAILHRYFG
mgnify:CR=1 FL=1